MPRDHDAAPACALAQIATRWGTPKNPIGHPKDKWVCRTLFFLGTRTHIHYGPSPRWGPPLRRLSLWRAYNDPSICQTIATARITGMVTCYRLARRFEPSRRFVRKARQRFSRTEINRTIRKNPKQSPTWNLWAFLSWRTSWSYASLSHLCRFLPLC